MPATTASPLASVTRLLLELGGEGVLNGAPASPLGSIRISKIGGGLELTSDFSALGATTVDVEIYNGGLLQAAFPGHTGPIATFSAWPGGGGLVRWWPGASGSNSEPCCSMIPFPVPQLITMAGSSSGSIVGDEIRVVPGASGGSLSMLQAMTVLAKDLGSFEIVSETALPSPPPVVYCTAKTTSNGCVPAIGGVGTPSATAGSGFVVTTTNMINKKPCVLFYSSSGQAAIPFQGGTLCVKTPIKRTPPTSTGGNPPPNDCSGAPSIDMNQFAVGGLGGTPAPYLQVPGTVICCQYWGRDPGFVAPNNTQLSDGLQYIVGP